MDSAASPPNRKSAPRRWRVRFSLLTLLLFVLTIGSGATLWWNWGPWGIAYVIEESSPICAAGFSPDGRFIYTITHPDDGIIRTEVTLRDAVSGGVQRRLHSEHHGDFARFSPSGDVLVAYDERGSPLRTWAAEIWSTATGERIEPPEGFARGHIDFSPDGKFAAGCSNFKPDTAMIVSLPDWKEVATYDNFMCFAHHKQSVVIAWRQITVKLVSLTTGETERTWHIGTPVTAAVLSPDDSLLAVTDGGVTYVFETAATKEFACKNGALNTSNDQSFSSNKKALLVDGSDRKSYVVDTQQYYQVALPNDFGHEQFELSLCDDLVVDKHGPKAFDLNRSKMQWVITGHRGEPLKGTHYMAVSGEDAGLPVESIVDMRSGATLINLTDWRLQRRLPPAEHGVQVDRDATCCLLRGPRDSAGMALKERKIAVCRQTRPMQWWGMAWLTEFWLTVFLASGFLWSIFKKR